MIFQPRGMHMAASISDVRGVANIAVSIWDDRVAAIFFLVLVNR